MIAGTTLHTTANETCPRAFDHHLDVNANRRRVRPIYYRMSPILNKATLPIPHYHLTLRRLLGQLGVLGVMGGPAMIASRTGHGCWLTDRDLSLGCISPSIGIRIILPGPGRFDALNTSCKRRASVSGSVHRRGGTGGSYLL